MMHEDAGDGVCANCPWCDANLDYAADTEGRGTCAWCGHPDVERLREEAAMWEQHYHRVLTELAALKGDPEAIAEMESLIKLVSQT